MRRHHWILLCTVLIGTTSVVMLLERFRPGESAIEIVSSNEEPSSSEQPPPDEREFPDGGRLDVVESGNGESTNAAPATSAPAPAGQQAPPTDVADALQPADQFDEGAALLEVEQILTGGPSSAATDVRLAELQSQLTIIASVREDLRTQLLDLLEADPYGPRADFIVEILTRLGDPETLSLGLRWVDSGDRELILKGLEVVSQRPAGVLDQQVLTATENLLMEHLDDPEILMSATLTMPVMPVDEQTRTSVVSTFRNLTGDSDGSVRSGSLFALSKWAQSASELSPLIDALGSTDLDDRRSAAMALQDSTVSDDEIGAALVARVEDGGELWEVRRIAADALSRFTLNDEQQGVLALFREEQEALVRSQ